MTSRITAELTDADGNFLSGLPDAIVSEIKWARNRPASLKLRGDIEDAAFRGQTDMQVEVRVRLDSTVIFAGPLHTDQADTDDGTYQGDASDASWWLWSTHVGNLDQLNQLARTDVDWAGNHDFSLALQKWQARKVTSLFGIPALTDTSSREVADVTTPTPAGADTSLQVWYAAAPDDDTRIQVVRRRPAVLELSSKRPTRVIFGAWMRIPEHDDGFTTFAANDRSVAVGWTRPADQWTNFDGTWPTPDPYPSTFPSWYTVGQFLETNGFANGSVRIDHPLDDWEFHVAVLEIPPLREARSISAGNQGTFTGSEVAIWPSLHGPPEYLWWAETFLAYETGIFTPGDLSDHLDALITQAQATAQNKSSWMNLAYSGATIGQDGPWWASHLDLENIGRLLDGYAGRGWFDWHLAYDQGTSPSSAQTRTVTVSVPERRTERPAIPVRFGIDGRATVAAVRRTRRGSDAAAAVAVRASSHGSFRYQRASIDSDAYGTGGPIPEAVLSTDENVEGAEVQALADTERQIRTNRTVLEVDSFPLSDPTGAPFVETVQVGDALPVSIDHGAIQINTSGDSSPFDWQVVEKTMHIDDAGEVTVTLTLNYSPAR